MTFKSTFSERNQAGSSEIRMYNGKPELNPVKIQMNICLLNNILRMFVLFVTEYLKARFLVVIVGLKN